VFKFAEGVVNSTINFFSQKPQKTQHQSHLLTDLKQLLTSEELNRRPDIKDRYAHPEDTTTYTKARKQQDLERLENITASDYTQELKSFQEAIYHITVQIFNRDPEGLWRYMELPISRMEKLESLFELGFFDLLHKLLKDVAQGNWRNIYPERRMPCILLAIQAGEKELVNYLLQDECVSLSQKHSTLASCLSNLIVEVKSLNLMNQEDATNISDKILSGQKISAEDMVNAIKWDEVLVAREQPGFVCK